MNPAPVPAPSPAPVPAPPGSRRRPRSRGVALINALVVVAALAAISAALLIRAELAVERQAMRGGTDQAAAYLRAGQSQALTELQTNIDAVRAVGIRPGQAWNQPRDVPIDRGRVAWQFHDLQSRFNLAWLSDEGEWGEIARAAFLRLAEGQGLSSSLAGRLARAAGPDTVARSGAFGTGTAPDLPLILPSQLIAVARPADGGPAALEPLWPYLSALPPEARLNPDTAALPVLQALLPGPSDSDWEEFDAARTLGLISGPEGLMNHAEQFWSDETLELLSRLPLESGSDWFELNMQAWLDTVTLRRSAVVSLISPMNPAGSEPRIVLSLPIVD